MSRIGRKPITVPAGVTVEISGNHIQVTGPKGTLELNLLPGIKIEQNENVLNVSKEIETPETGRSYGLPALSRSMVSVSAPLSQGTLSI